MEIRNELTGYPSVDKPWLKYYDDEFKQVHCTIYDRIENSNRNRLTSTALQYYGKKISFMQMFKLINDAAKAFAAYGVKDGDRVSLLTLSCPEAIIAILALNRLGALANMVNPTFTKEQIRDRIEEAEPRLVIVLDQLFGLVSEYVQTSKQTFVVVRLDRSMPLYVRIAAYSKLKKKIPYSKNVLSWDAFIKKGTDAVPVFSQYEPDKATVMVYSSGSTGASKGIVLTNDGINATISNYDRKGFPHEEGWSNLAIVPFWFSTGLVTCAFVPLVLGVSLIIEPIFSIKTFTEDILRYKPNMTLAATSIWLGLMEHPKVKKTDLSFMYYPITGGEKILERTAETINLFFKEHNCTSPLIVGYGMCELGSTITTDDKLHRKNGSAGFPILGVTLAAFDPETGRELKYGERGEIRVSSPAIMKGYYKRPEADTEFLWNDEEGRKWGRTGDIGCVDEDGFVYIHGRAGDTFTGKSGRKYYGFDVEDVILKNENVYQCEVIGVDEGEGYEKPYAFIVLEKTCRESKEKLINSIHKLCCEELDSEAIPVGYKVLDAFPVLPSGKRNMHALRENIMEMIVPEN